MTGKGRTPYELVVTVLHDQAKRSPIGLTAAQIAKKTGLTVGHARMRAIQVVGDRGHQRGAKMRKIRARGNPMAFYWGDPAR